MHFAMNIEAPVAPVAPAHFSCVHLLNYPPFPRWDRRAERAKLAKFGVSIVQAPDDLRAKVLILNVDGETLVDCDAVADPGNGAPEGTVEYIVRRHCQGFDPAHPDLYVPPLDTSRTVMSRDEYARVVNGQEPLEPQIRWRVTPTAAAVTFPPPPQLAQAQMPVRHQKALQLRLEGGEAHDQAAPAPQPRDPHRALRRELTAAGFKILLDEEISVNLREEVLHAGLPLTEHHGPSRIYVYPSERMQDGFWRVPRHARVQARRHMWYAEQKGTKTVEARWLAMCLLEGQMLPFELGGLA